VAEHLDHLHYLSDILLLDIKDLNAVLTEHLLHKLFVPLYIFSLTPAPPPPSLAVVTQNLAAVLNRNVDIDIQEIHNPRVSSIVALFLLSLVFLVVSHAPLVHALAWVVLNGDHSVFKEGAAEILNSYVEHREVVVPGFGEPNESLEQALDTVTGQSSASSYALSEDSGVESSSPAATELDSQAEAVEAEQTKLRNITDEEKQLLQKSSSAKSDFTEMAKPFLDTVLHALDCTENDYLALLSLCLIYAMSHNRGKLYYYLFVLSLPLCFWANAVKLSIALITPFVLHSNCFLCVMTMSHSGTCPTSSRWYVTRPLQREAQERDDVQPEGSGQHDT